MGAVNLVCQVESPGNVARGLQRGGPRRARGARREPGATDRQDPGRPARIGGPLPRHARGRDRVPARAAGMPGCPGPAGGRVRGHGAVGRPRAVRPGPARLSLPRPHGRGVREHPPADLGPVPDPGAPRPSCPGGLGPDPQPAGRAARERRIWPSSAAGRSPIRVSSRCTWATAGRGSASWTRNSSSSGGSARRSSWAMRPGGSTRSSRIACWSARPRAIQGSCLSGMGKRRRARPSWARRSGCSAVSSPERLDDPELLPWLERECRLEPLAARMIAAIPRPSATAGGVVPDDRTILIESFPDQSGELGLAVLTPFGGTLHLGLKLALLGADPPTARPDARLPPRRRRSSLSTPEPRRAAARPLRRPDRRTGREPDPRGAARTPRCSACGSARTRPVPCSCLAPTRPSARRSGSSGSAPRTCCKSPGSSRISRSCSRRTANASTMTSTCPAPRASSTRSRTDRSGWSADRREIPSPMTSELIFSFTAAHVYAWDEPKRNDRQPARSVVDEDLLGSPARDGGAAIGLARSPGDRSCGQPAPQAGSAPTHRRGNGRTPPPARRPDGSRARTARWRRFSTSCKRPVGPTRSSCPEPPIRCGGSLAEDFSLYREAFPGAIEDGASHGPDMAPPIRPAENACMTIVERFLQTHALIGLADLTARYPISPAEATELLERWAEEGKAVRLAGPDGSEESQWAERENLAEIRRATVAVTASRESGGRTGNLRPLLASMAICPSVNSWARARRSSRRRWSSSRATRCRHGSGRARSSRGG